MENYGLVEEGNIQRSSSTAPASKSVASLVKIDSISIDLGIAMEKKEAEKCHHFSIRGYVAEMRNKDVKLCAPFPLDGNLTNMREQLEPLYVAKFRWWRCQSCVQQIGAASASRDLPDLEKSPNLNGDESYPLLCSNEKEKNFPVGLTAISGDVGNKQAGDKTLNLTNCLPCQIQESHADRTATMELKGSELVAICEPNPGIDESANAILAIEYPGYKSSTSDEICHMKKGNSLDEEQRNGFTVCETSKEVLKINDTSPIKDAAIRHPSLEPEQCSNDLVKCDETFGDNRHIKQNETSTGLPRRKTRKVRLMTELLKGRGNVERDQIASYNAMPNAFAALASSSAQRKKKMHQEPSREVRYPNNEAKKVRALKGDAETTIATIKISDSESEEDASAAGIGFRSYMPLQQTGKRSCSSKMKNKMLQGEDRQASYIPQKSMFGESSRENIGLDLSLNSYVNVEHKINNPQKKDTPNNDHQSKDGRIIGKSSAPNLSFGSDVLSDLNERIAHRTAILHQQQNSLSLHKKLDFNIQCSNTKPIEPEGRSGVSRTNTNRRTEKVFDKTSDDIPMEIVELLAKHQFERSLSEAERSSCLEKRINERNYEMMGFSEVHGNGVTGSLQKENDKWNPVKFSHPNRNNILVGRREENPILPMFSTYSQSPQQKVSSSAGAQPSTSRIVRNGSTQNHPWNGDKVVHKSSPTTIKVFDACNASHTGQQQIGKTGNIWSSVSPSLMPPPRPNIPQKLASQTNNIGTHSQRPDLHKGKTIRDLDLNLADPNAADLEISPEYSLVTKDVGMEPNPKGTGSLDSFSNETIPAMQLLSLMDAGMQSRAPFSVNAKKILEKPFFPCDNHPNFSMDKSSNFFEKPLFPHNHQFKEFSGLGPATYKASGSSRHMLSTYYGQDFVRSQEPEKAKRSYLSSLNKDWRSRKPVGTSGISDPIHDFNPRQNKQKGIIGASDNVVIPLQSRILQNSTSYIDLGACHMHGTIGPLESISKTGICTVNRNPADFSIPDAGNVYMIQGEDLRFGKKDYFRSKTGGVDGRKRQRVTKLAAPKECPLIQAP